MQKRSAILLVDDDDDPTTSFLHGLLLKDLGLTDQLLVAEHGAEAYQPSRRPWSSSCSPPPCTRAVWRAATLPVAGLASKPLIKEKNREHFANQLSAPASGPLEPAQGLERARAHTVRT